MPISSSLYRFEVVIPNVNGIPRDSVTNTLYARCTSDSDADAFAVQVLDFYGLDALSGVAVSEYFSPELSRVANSLRVKYYAMSDPTPRVPRGEVDGALQAALDTGLPAQVAVVLSFQAAVSSGTNRARRRGRLYLGPLNGAALATVGDETVVSTDFINTAIKAAQLYLFPTTHGFWAVYSRTDNDDVLVDNGWVDNRFDTQRRRLPRATARTTFNATTP